MRLVENRSDLMVVPSIGIVVHYDHRCAAPFTLGLQKVDHVDQEGLFVQRVGIPSMSVLVRWRFEEVHRREIARLDRGKEVVDVILMIRGTGVSNFRNRRGPRVTWIGGRRVVLEESMMRDVIARCTRKAGRTPLAARGSIGVLHREVKPTHERPPTNTSRVEQIADILSLHSHHRAARANVPDWVRIVYYGE